MQKKLFVPLSLSTKPVQGQNQLLSPMLDRFWRDTRKYLGLAKATTNETSDNRRHAG